MKKLYGVTAAMVTPFTENGKVDTRNLAILTDKLVKKGIHCLYPCGTTGEMVHLTEDERKELAETVVRAADGRARVFIHCGAMRQEETEALLDHAFSIGADGAGIVTPMFLGADDKETAVYYKRLSSRVPSDFPIYFYNIPLCSGDDLKVTTAAEIARDCNNVIGIKYSFPDMLRTLEYLHIPSFSVLHGCDKMFAELLMMGCDGTVSGVAGVFPEPFTAVYDAFQGKDLDEMKKWQDICVDFCDLLRCGSNMSWFKEALRLRGLPVGGMRAPQLDLPEEETKILFHELKALCEKSGIPLEL